MEALAMTHFPQADTHRRAVRIKFGDSVPALVLSQDGKRAQAKLKTVSVTGGLLSLPRALAQGDFVELAFETQRGQVHGMAEMLHPLTGGASTMQAFRFIAMDDDDHRSLRMMVDSALDRKEFNFRVPTVRT